MIQKRDFLEVAKEFYNKEFKDAKCGFVAGSLVKGRGTINSDIDLYVVYDFAVLPKAYRKTIIYQDYIIECFVQNENSLNYFLEKEPSRGECVATNMILEGIVLPNESEYSKQVKAKAKAIYDKGPKVFSKEDIESCRYSITDLLDDIPAKSRGELLGTLAVLHQKLGDFYLRANNKWSGSRKSLHYILKAHNSDLAERYLLAFEKAHEEDFSLLMKLADEILAPFGGRLIDGFKSIAPDEANKSLFS